MIPWWATVLLLPVGFVIGFVLNTWGCYYRAADGQWTLAVSRESAREKRKGFSLPSPSPREPE